eukprot:11225651-Ditylum_brightwellii.AAC.2
MPPHDIPTKLVKLSHMATSFNTSHHIQDLEMTMGIQPRSSTDSNKEEEKHFTSQATDRHSKEDQSVPDN